MYDSGNCLDLLKNWVVIWNVKSQKKMLLLLFYQSNLLTMVILELIQLLMTIKTVFTKELKLLIIISLRVTIDKRKNVIIVGDSMLNNTNSCRLLKSNKFSVCNHLGATSENILSAVEETLKTNLDTLIVYAGTNDLTKTINMLRNVKKICKKVERISSGTKIAFCNIIY